MIEVNQVSITDDVDESLVIKFLTRTDQSVDGDDYFVVFLREKVPTRLVNLEGTVITLETINERLNEQTIVGRDEITLQRMWD